MPPAPCEALGGQFRSQRQGALADRFDESRAAGRHPLVDSLWDTGNTWEQRVAGLAAPLPVLRWPRRLCSPLVSDVRPALNPRPAPPLARRARAPQSRHGCDRLCLLPAYAGHPGNARATTSRPGSLSRVRRSIPASPLAALVAEFTATYNALRSAAHTHRPRISTLLEDWDSDRRSTTFRPPPGHGKQARHNVITKKVRSA